jgi:hypothetical protein
VWWAEGIEFGIGRREVPDMATGSVLVRRKLVVVSGILAGMVVCG